ncbi:hypothetical protein GJ744_000672 [Endocarpon pusillum]|uniref:Uncharacterized protein n=1 Tax=Endocarpon pusillum TaxID=364733 RepID=A0A8H7E1P5_9EURO|nr:hypothetical protein GJ744_000672 [Endocarpon pusillum]
MPHPDYIETPQTAADNSYLTNGLDGLDDLSPEKSFASPSKGRDLIQGIRNGRGLSLKTPRAGARDPLRLLPNGAGKKSEFTPLMMSVTKKNHMRRASGRKTGAQTPSFMMDNSINNGPTPGLPRMGDESCIYEERTSSSAGDAANETPLPQAVASSSAQSTPLAQLPGRNGGGGVVGDGNMMTLREQENVSQGAQETSSTAC